MEQNLQAILDLINADATLSDDEKAMIISRLNAADKKMTIDAFRIERGDTVKKTMSVLLEETIEELEQKRIAVEEKNRDLEIEASLERVRAQAMSMARPDELLGICEILFTELEGLGFNEIRNSQIFIYNDHKGSFTNYGFSEYEGAAIAEIFYNSHPTVNAFVTAVRKTNDAFAELSISGDELKAWRDYRIENGEPDDPRLANINTLYYYFYSIGVGAIGISNFEPISAEQLAILKRFRNVFDFAYRRYTDVSQAEAQAREAQIELGLERVRARAMAMQNSGELSDLVTTLFNELAKLDFALSWCAIIIIDESSLFNTAWVANLEPGKPLESFKLPFADYPYPNAILKAWRERKIKWAYVLSGKEKDIHHDFLFSKTEFARIPETVKVAMRATENSFVSFSFSNFGGLQTTGTEPLSEESLDILARFGKVFDLTYTRFNDLKLAESQAREAQIELGLERVRARAMAMQSSEELSDLVTTLFDELTKLDFALSWCVINIIDEPTLVNTVWLANLESGKAPETFQIQFADYPFPNAMKQAWKERRSNWVYELKGEEKQVYFEFLFDETEFGRIPEATKAAIRAQERQVASFTFSNFGGLQTVGGEPLSEESLDILSRFGKVFDLTYTRFNDLKQAEEQAREAQIELALERVRARTMAMQRSGELPETASVLFQQFKDLGGDPIQITIGIINEAEGVIEFSVTDWRGGGFQIGGSFKGSIDEPTLLNKEYKAWKAQKKSLVVDLSGQELQDWISYRNIWSGTIARSEDTYGRRVVSFAFFSKGHISISTTEPPPPETIRLLERFAGVFDGTYTRFLDLQKAEAQAREAKIELALERVRSRAMAMHKTNELGDAAELLYKELIGLGIDSLSVCYVLVNEKDKTGAYYGINPVDGKMMSTPMHAPHTETSVMRAMWASWLKQEPVCFIALDPKASLVHQTYIGKLMAATFAAHGIAPEFTVEGFLSVSPERVHIYSLNFKQGYLFLVGGAPLPASDVDILTRFTKVFELTYTRFLDLQKAEAQAHEGRIELALERVRARTMAMQHSDELAETAFILFQQFRDLGENPDQATIGIINEAEGVVEYWVTIYGNQTNKVFKFPIDEPNVTRKIYDAWKAQEKSLVIDLSGQALYDFSKFRESMGGAGYNEAEQRRIINVAFFSKGLINVQSTVTRSAESLRLLERFASVFEGTYTRFLDLKKAEAQAREAQIELALERVRAKTMAMQHSDELLETSEVVFQQLRDLGETADQISIAIVKEDEGIFDVFATIYGNQMVRVVHPKIDDPFVMGRVYKNWKAHKKSFVIELGGEDLRQYNIVRNQLGAQSYYNEDIGPNDRWIVSAACFSKGLLSFSSSKEPTKEAGQLLERFAKVFDSTYTRFLDLQRAEAQAREAQIEAALEKVRSRSLAMHHPEELREVVAIVFEKLVELNFATGAACILVFAENSKDILQWIAHPGQAYPQCFKTPYLDTPILADIFMARQNRLSSFAKVYPFEEKNAFWEYFLSHGDYKQLPAELKQTLLQSENYAISYAFEKNSAISAPSLAGRLLSEKENEILKRFARVFEQAYVRFIDLQKAEAQARESQIQLALERIRARTMAMQKSDELAETVSLVFKQLLALGIGTEQIRTCGIVTFNDNEPVGEQWITETNGEIIPQSFMVPYNEAPAYKSIYKGWKDGEKFMVIHLEGKALAAHLGYLAKGTNVPIRDVVLPQQAKEIFNHVLFFSQGCLFIITKEALPEYHDVFKRFGAVFQQSYTRFLDLKKAEAQAREGQIQLAMERVRARTMAMQRSDELTEASYLLDSQVRALGIETRGCAFNIYGENESTEWFGTETGTLVYKTPREEAFLRYYEAGQRGETLCIEDFVGDACKAHYEYLCTLPFVGDELKKMHENGWSFPAHQIDHVVYFKFGYLLFITFEPVPEAHDIFKRFAAVFEQTYTRFLDLKHAEEQARDAKIEAALERTRTQSMIMQHSGELDDTLRVFHEQILHLGIDSAFSFLWLPDEEKDLHIFWAAWAENASKTFKSKAIVYPLDRDEPATAQCLVDWKGNDPVVSYRVPPEGVENYFAAWKELIDGVEQLKPEYFQGGLYYVEAFMKYGCFGVMVESQLAEDEKKILGRMAIEFERTYTRFLDLKKAEAQTREAEIELGLERVRARTMAMQKSDELKEIIKVVYEQFVHLNIAVEHAGFIMDYNTRDDMHIWLADKHYAPAEITVPYFDSPHWNGFNEAKDKGLNFFAIYNTFEEKNKFYQDLFKLIPGVTDETKEYYLTCPGLAISTVLLENVSLYIENFAGTPYTDDDNATLMRFGKVFQQTYTRFLDLQRAEAQAREAVKQASLDRVRGEIASMRTTTDLERITPLIWNELTILGIPFIRCGVFIVDEAAELIHTHLSTPDGKAIAAFDLPFDAEGIGREVLPAWRKKQMAAIHWSAKEFAANTKNLVSQGAIKSRGKYVTERPDTTLDLHFFPFLQGMLYVGNIEPLNDDAKDLVQSLAEAFSTAYARYEDFNKLEAAKQQVDKTLTDLKSAQTQLIQTEKMASLGELTAGIAHEIQNPLNFVNNFSEVNAELIEEMKAEIEKGDLEEIKALALDIEENSKKINQHGKRADGIVKGMLQHSQSGSGVKELTNINSVADEYMRLAYHGLRAKDKSFNAEMHTHFDPTLPKIKVIPQDTGRVLLNLFNNAFYAVNKKQKTAGTGYKPEITITTLSVNGQVIIKVKDNGIGIPDAIKEKIMQPFFTTKPTGEGTGLGLSLTYDMVVKGHGGSIQVDSVEGEGSEFIITLPIS